MVGVADLNFIIFTCVLSLAVYVSSSLWLRCVVNIRQPLPTYVQSAQGLGEEAFVFATSGSSHLSNKLVAPTYIRELSGTAGDMMFLTESFMISMQLL